MEKQETIEKLREFCKLRAFCELYPDACQKDNCEIYMAIKALSEPSLQIQLDDLINRQDVYDLIDNWDEPMISKSAFRCDIEDLPDVQPKATDLISRQSAIVQTSKVIHDDAVAHDVKEVLKALPSAQPEQRWIPCSERLPEDDTLMLVNYIDHRPDAGDMWIGWHEMENVWYIDGEEHSEERGNEVVAWMPLPEPYKEGAQE